MKITLDETSGRLNLSFGYNKDLVNAIKDLPIRSFDPDTKSWWIGFDESNLSDIIDLLARFNWPPDLLNDTEKQAKAYLASIPSPNRMPRIQYEESVKPYLIQIGELIVSAYMDNRIDQAEQSAMLDIINHISLKDFVRQ